MPELLLEMRNISLSYRTNVSAVKELNLRLYAGESVSVIGPSGCGKSTLLAIASGILKPSAGEVLYKGQPIKGPSRERVIIFQDHALFPWRSARQNVEFALRARGVLAREARETGAHFLELVGLKDFADYFPHQLSGGMQQRVGIARALAADPELLLLDEPFASLDMIHREELLQDLLALARQFRKTLLLVTHNVDEALFMGDHVDLMSGSPGRIVQRLHSGFSKPTSFFAFRKGDEFQQLERSVYEHLHEFSH